MHECVSPGSNRNTSARQCHTRASRAAMLRTRLSSMAAWASISTRQRKNTSAAARSHVAVLACSPSRSTSGLFSGTVSDTLTWCLCGGATTSSTVLRLTVVRHIRWGGNVAWLCQPRWRRPHTRKSCWVFWEGQEAGVQRPGGAGHPKC